MRAYLRYAGMGMQMVVVMGICTWAGLQLDRRLELRFPVFLSLFSVGSTALCVYGTIRKLLKQIQQQQEKEH
jgi:hypothetical protein